MTGSGSILGTGEWLVSTEMLAFTVEHVARLTGLSPRQLRYWAETEFFVPSMAVGGPRSPYGRIYSFRDVVGLRTIAVLRKEREIPLQELRKISDELAAVRAAPWSSLRIYVYGKTIAFGDPVTGVPVSTRPFGQTPIVVALEPIVHDMRIAAARLAKRTPEQYGKIERHRYVVHNEPIVAGTRIPTIAIRNLSEAGYSETDILREYPRLTAADVRAALDFERSRARKRAG